MKFRMCSCRWKGLTRPEGPIKIEKTALQNSNPAKSADILTAKLSGAVNAEVSVIRDGNKYFFKAPKELGGLSEVPADSLTDCLNYKVWEMGTKVTKKQGKKPAEHRTRGGH